MHAAFLFPREFIGAPDLQGKDVTLTIAKLVVEKVPTDKGPEDKWVLHFAEMLERVKKDKTAINKRLCLNRTNAKSISKLHGPETDNWVGKRITLYATTCRAFGETVECIRIRKQKPTDKTKPNLPPPEQRKVDEPELPKADVDVENPDGPEPGPDVPLA